LHDGDVLLLCDANEAFQDILATTQGALSVQPSGFEGVTHKGHRVHASGTISGVNFLPPLPRFERRSIWREAFRAQVLVVDKPGAPGAPKTSRMALALRFEELIGKGQVRDFAELARLGHVSRA
jgi:hypothetical protein